MKSVRFLMAVAIGLAFASSPAVAQNPAGRKPDQTADLLAKLRKPLDLEKHVEIPLEDFASHVGEKAGLAILINEAAFRAVDPNANPGTMTLKVPQLKAMALTTTLPLILGQVDATFLVRKDHIDIVPIAYAAKETRNVVQTDDDSPVQMAEPLVSMIFKEKPFNEAVAELAEEYNLTVVVSPQSGDARTGFVSARLLNTPADKALELLAVQCDLRIVRKANSFLVTSHDHADGLFQEQLDHERAKIEVERLRTAPFNPPQPQLAVQPQPQPPAPNPAPPPPKP
jgi:hypothetical protein